jgi:predicted kinase
VVFRPFIRPHARHRKIVGTLGTLAIVAIIGFGTVSATWSADGGGGLARADAVVQEAGDLSHLLSDKTLLDRYYAALRDYYGKDRFPRKAFDDINALLRNSLREHPELTAELSQRLFETTGMGAPFTIKVDYPSTGLRLNTGKWTTELQNWKNQLDKDSAEIRKAGGPNEQMRALKEKISGLNRKLTDAQRDLQQQAGLRTKQRKELEGRLFQTFSRDPDLKQISAYLLRSYLEQPSVKRELGSSDAELTLAALSDMRENSALIFKSTGLEKDASPLLSSALKKQVITRDGLVERGALSPKMLLAHTDKLIPVGTAPAGEYRFAPPPRRIHALYKGLFYDECVGSSCGLDMFGNRRAPSLERVLTIALHGTELRNVEVNGNYSGFVQSVPVVRDSVRVGSTEFFSGAFGHRFVQKTGLDQSGRKSSDMLDLWLHEASLRKPEDWSGYALSEGASWRFNNANVVGNVQNSPAYVLGESIGRGGSFRVDDPVARIIPDLTPKGYAAKAGAGNMIVDAVPGGGGDVVLFKQVSSEEVEGLLSDPAKIRALFAESHNEARRSGLAHLIGESRSRDPEIQLTLIDELLRDERSEKEWYGQTHFRDVATEAIRKLPIEDAVVLKTLVKGLKENIDADLVLRLQSLIVEKANGNLTAQLELVSLFGLPDSKIRRFARESFEKVAQASKDPRVFSALRPYLESGDKTIARNAITALIDSRTQDSDALLYMAKWLLKEAGTSQVAQSNRKQVLSATQQILAWLRRPGVSESPSKSDESLSTIMDHLNPEIRRAAELASAQTHLPTITKASQALSLPQSIDDFRKNEQTLHYKNLGRKGRFDVPIPQELLQEHEPSYSIGYYLVPEGDAHFLGSKSLSSELLAEQRVEIEGRYYYRYFVHPLSENYYKFISDNPACRYVPPERSEFRATPSSSYRSLIIQNTRDLEAPPFIYKLGINIYEKGVHRLVSQSEVERSLTNQRAFEALGENYLNGIGLKLFSEPAGFVLNRAAFPTGPPEMGGAILRQFPEEMIRGDIRWISMASLMSPERKGEPLIMEVIKQSGLSSEEFVQKYMVDGFARIYKSVALEKGLSFQPNATNWYLETTSDLKPTGNFVLKDLEGIYPDAIQVAKTPEIRSLYLASDNPKAFMYDIGRVHPVIAYGVDYHDDVLIPLLSQIGKYDRGFKPEKRRKIMMDLDQRVMDLLISHFGIPHAPSLKPPWNSEIYNKIYELIPQYTRFQARPDHVKLTNSPELARYLERKIEAGEAIGLTLDPNELKEWAETTTYLSRNGLEFVDHRGMLAGFAPLNSKEVAALEGDDHLSLAALNRAWSVENTQSSHRESSSEKLFGETVDRFVKRAPSTSRPTLVLMAGGYGAGKTTVRNQLSAEGIFPESRYLAVDADEIRELLPRYQSLKSIGIQEAIAATQEDLTDLTLSILNKALAEKKNVILDQSMRSPEIIREILDSHPEYRSIIVHVEAPTEMVHERVRSRAQETGREIPEKVVAKSLRDVNSSVRELQDRVDMTLRIHNAEESVIVSARTQGKEIRINQSLSEAVLQLAARVDPRDLESCVLFNLRNALSKANSHSRSP